jgi:hypothetical protein
LHECNKYTSTKTRVSKARSTKEEEEEEKEKLVPHQQKAIAYLSLYSAVQISTAHLATTVPFRQTKNKLSKLQQGLSVCPAWRQAICPIDD